MTSDSQPSGSTRDDTIVLTSRQQQVAGLVALGLSNRVVGEKLFISARTVESHLQAIMEKLDVHTRTEIAVWFHSHTDEPD
jgi:DNA-binding NarL/FixJ family response regulator